MDRLNKALSLLVPLFLGMSINTIALVISGNSTAADVPLQWGSIGDSWNSGVAYSLSTLYDNNKNGCLRLKDSYTDQMDKDKSWVVQSLSPTTLKWPGCSGSILFDMYLGKQQIKDTGAPQFVVMTAGGNNADFGTLARKCMYNDNPVPYAYGKPYHLDTDGTGQCKLGLATARTYINDGGPRGLAQEFRNTIDDLFKWARDEKKLSSFYLYVTGYAHFFNQDTTDCDNWSFSAFPRFADDMPLLVKGLRTEMNTLEEQFMQVYRNVIASYKPPQNMFLKFVPVTDGFQQHRFCEPGATFEDQYYNDNTYLWSLQFIDKNGQAIQGTTVNMPNGQKFMSLTQDAADFLKNIGNIADAVAKGWTLRPFHPKFRGHTAIKDAVIRQLKADKVPGVKF